ncbi:MAG: glucose-6-phosphate 1-dehydrogenase, partial [Chloroflexi bacterium]|nr:glucose-6-phosphate 1-dehydrogenase [Chloroflexota bacterium]
MDCVQITVAESLGVEQRGAFYEETGAIRDIVQNHPCSCSPWSPWNPPGVPFLLRTGKRLARRDTRVVMIFR